MQSLNKSLFALVYKSNLLSRQISTASIFSFGGKKEGGKPPAGKPPVGEKKEKVLNLF